MYETSDKIHMHDVAKIDTILFVIVEEGVKATILAMQYCYILYCFILISTNMHSTPIEKHPGASSVTNIPYRIRLI